MAFKAGRIDPSGNLSGSMAEAIEQALAHQWPYRHGHGLPARGRGDRQMLFAALAQGVLAHLHEHAREAMELRVDTTQVDGNVIVSEGHVDLGAGLGTRDVEVTQKSPEQVPGDNRVVSTGRARIVAVDVEDLLP